MSLKPLLLTVPLSVLFTWNEQLILGTKKMEFLSKPTLSLTSVLIKPNPQVTKLPSSGNRTALIEQRRALG
jgi:hypothetical protein